jgi:hypothetical protein
MHTWQTIQNYKKQNKRLARAYNTPIPTAKKKRASQASQKKKKKKKKKKKSVIVLHSTPADS